MSGVGAEGLERSSPEVGAAEMAAIEKAISEARFAEAVELLEAGLRTLVGWQPQRLLDAFAKMPPPLIESSTRLNMARRFTESFLFQDHPRAMVEAAKRFASRGSSSEISDTVFAGLGEILALRSVRDIRGGLPIADRDRALVDSRRIEWLEVEGWIRSLALLQWGMTRMLAQDLRGAVRDFQEAYWAGARSTMPHFARNAAEFAALLLALCDSAEGAREWLEKARALPPVPGQLRTFMEDWGPLIEATLALDRLELEAAKEALERYRPAPQLHLAWSVVAWLRARILLLQGMADTALDLADLVNHPRGGAPDPGSFDEALLVGAEAELALAVGRLPRAEIVLELAPQSPFLHPTRARLALARGDFEEAVVLSVSGLHHEVPFGRVDLKAIGAAAHRRLERTEAAAELFGHALELSRVLGIVAPFALLPRADLEALVALVPRARVELERVLASLPVGGAEKVPVIELSERERRVLAELASTPSTREIAVRLFVSVNTVKSQLRSIYRKLGVHSREAALEVAHELGFELGHGRR